MIFTNIDCLRDQFDSWGEKKCKTSSRQNLTDEQVMKMVDVFLNGSDSHAQLCRTLKRNIDKR